MNTPTPPQAAHQSDLTAAIRSAERVAVSFYAKFRADLKATREYLDEYDLLLARDAESGDERITHERDCLADLLEQMGELSKDCRDHCESFMPQAKPLSDRKPARSKGWPMQAARNRLQKAVDNIAAYSIAVNRICKLGGCDYDRVKSANELVSFAYSNLYLAQQQFSREQNRRVNTLLPAAPKVS